ncbi:hypothetical protein M1L60_31985 [Actinoplanes sp. TRM 88003]|uniref:Uncharacterized protein n=1 Tax=Paractinoplanes aksuensis TaxID=2939490 RepID=A0ABT1DWQ2_9ACTN|nr:hypothetical protein [Actinoplanes aksuensis]MCO8275212.1 hypothetical protein [Actinoplanes aksuensis]
MDRLGPRDRSTGLTAVGWIGLGDQGASHLSRVHPIDLDIHAKPVAGLGDDVAGLTGRAGAGAEARPGPARWLSG